MDTFYYSPSDGERESERTREKRKEEGEGNLFAEDDYANLVDELDAELSYLNAPKAPPPKPVFCPVMRCILFLYLIYNYPFYSLG
jgi:hypothetical protein